MKQVILPAILLHFAASILAFAQEEPQCDTPEGMAKTLAEEYQEEPILSVRDPSNNDLYQIFAQNLIEGAPSWSLVVTDPEQEDPALQSCIVGEGQKWALNSVLPTPATPYSDDVLSDLNASFEANSCVSLDGYLALSSSDLWANETINFSGENEATNTKTIISSNTHGEGFIGIAAALPDMTSLHPYAVTDTQYCLAVSGIVENMDIKTLQERFGNGIGIPENGI